MGRRHCLKSLLIAENMAAAMPFVFRHVAAMPDVHVGIGATVGSVIPTKGAVIPAAVGVDIGCGMVAAISMAIILLHRLWLLATNQLTEQELIGVRESEEEPIDVPAPLK